MASTERDRKNNKMRAAKIEAGTWTVNRKTTMIRAIESTTTIK
jgi:hypothetical protein